MITKKSYTPTAGTHIITDSSLVNIKMLMVAREGNTYDIIRSNNDIQLDYREVRYSAANGELVFNVNIPFNPNEIINIVYDTIP